MAKLLLVNPRKRRKARRKNPVRKLSRKRRRKNPISNLMFRKRRRRTGASLRRRNPIGGGLPSPKSLMRGVQSNIGPAALAGVGAVTLDFLWANLPIPATLRTGPVMYGAKVVGAVLMGAAARSLGAKPATADALVAGAMTVVAYNAMRTFVAAQFPTAKLGMYVNGLGYVNPAQLGMYTDGSGLPTLDPMRDIGAEDISGADLDPCALQ